MSATDPRDGHDENCNSCRGPYACDCGWTEVCLQQMKAERDEAIAERDRAREDADKWERRARDRKGPTTPPPDLYIGRGKFNAVVAERDSLQREVERLRPIVEHVAGLRVSDSRGYSQVHRSLAAIAREALSEPSDAG